MLLVGVPECSLGMVKETIDKMTEAGHRYKYLEAKFGCGVALVLGKDVPESMCAFMTPPFVLIELTIAGGLKRCPKVVPILIKL
jgi:3-polyprenyl-4-hydroxybenzoate decarboxylase